MTDHKPAEPAQLALDLDDKPDTHIYVASALTALEPTERSRISRRCDSIDQAIVASCGSIEKPWKVHLPILWSAPGPGNDRAPREIYNFNRDHVRRASGLVLLGDHGGSLGAGQEFAWAIARTLPVLVLLTGDEPLSRQIAGTPAQMSVRRVATDDDLRAAATEWVTEWGRDLESRARSGTGQLIIAIRAADRLQGAFAVSPRFHRGHRGRRRSQPRASF